MALRQPAVAGGGRLGWTRRMMEQYAWEASSRRTMALVYLLGAWSVIALGIGLERTKFWAGWMD